MNLKAMLRYAPQAVTRPRWLWDYAKSGRIPDLTAPNLRGPEDKPVPTFFGAYRQWMESPLPSWDDVAWLREQWGDGPFMLKRTSCAAGSTPHCSASGIPRSTT
jgi:L-lactate dehydrogenase (cytochrome)/glycolate oxidase